MLLEQAQNQVMNHDLAQILSPLSPQSLGLIYTGILQGTQWNFQFILDQSLHRTGKGKFWQLGGRVLLSPGSFLGFINTTISIKCADKLGNVNSNLPAGSD